MDQTQRSFNEKETTIMTTTSQSLPTREIKNGDDSGISSMAARRSQERCIFVSIAMAVKKEKEIALG